MGVGAIRLGHTRRQVAQAVGTVRCKLGCKLGRDRQLQLLIPSLLRGRLRAQSHSTRSSHDILAIYQKDIAANEPLNVQRSTLGVIFPSTVSASGLR